MDPEEVVIMRIGSLASSVVLLLTAVPCLAQQKNPSATAGYDPASRATVVHEAQVYIAADPASQKVTVVSPGHEVVVMERSGGWLRVFADTDVEENPEEVPMFGEAAAAQPASGWMKDKGVIGPATPQGDLLLFGSAANEEVLAEDPHAPKDAAQSAHLLYRRLDDYFPQSPLAPEAAWRSADIRWQLEKQDISSLPSAHEQASYLRPQIYEDQMRKVAKTYRGTKWEALAEYELLDNKLCGDWQGLPKCPEQEAGLYLKYANQFPQGPKTADALYNAAYREGALVDMYNVDGNRKRSDIAASRSKDIAQQLESQFPGTDDAARAATLIYKLQQGIAIYGSDRD